MSKKSWQVRLLAISLREDSHYYRFHNLFHRQKVSLVSFASFRFFEPTTRKRNYQINLQDMCCVSTLLISSYHLETSNLALYVVKLTLKDSPSYRNYSGKKKRKKKHYYGESFHKNKLHWFYILFNIFRFYIRIKNKVGEFQFVKSKLLFRLRKGLVWIQRRIGFTYLNQKTMH